MREEEKKRGHELTACAGPQQPFHGTLEDLGRHEAIHQAINYILR